MHDVGHLPRLPFFGHLTMPHAEALQRHRRRGVDDLAEDVPGGMVQRLARLLADRLDGAAQRVELPGQLQHVKPLFGARGAVFFGAQGFPHLHELRRTLPAQGFHQRFEQILQFVIQ